MHTRREFVKQFIGGGAAFISYRSIAAESERSRSDAPEESIGNNTGDASSFLVDNPYAEVDWTKTTCVTSTTHVHVEDQEKLDLYYHKFGLRHFAISNYYPSAPAYPLKSIRYNQYKVEQDFGMIVNLDPTKTGKARWADGKFVEGPFRWNDIIAKGPRAWAHELPASLQANLPFRLGDLIFKNVPDDVLVSPNAEHHGFLNSELHACAVGSLYCSGNFDAHDVYKTQEHGYAIGTGLPWEIAFKKMTDPLLYADAGGITINHPIWSRLPFEDITRMLDFDHRVLGIEVYNDGDTYTRGEDGSPIAVDLWDKILCTGRRCLGFFVPDHSVARGKNVLMVPALTEYECLKAYRKGAFIGTIIGTGLQFTRIHLEDNRLTVALNEPANISFITDAVSDKQNVASHFAREADYKIPTGPDGCPTISYVRVEVVDYTSTEQLFSQPIRFIKNVP